MENISGSVVGTNFHTPWSGTSRPVHMAKCIVISHLHPWAYCGLCLYEHDNLALVGSVLAGWLCSMHQPMTLSTHSPCGCTMVVYFRQNRRIHTEKTWPFQSRPTFVLDSPHVQLCSLSQAACGETWKFGTCDFYAPPNGGGWDIINQFRSVLTN